MYTSNAEFIMPDGIENMCREFFTTFCVNTNFQNEEEANTYFSALHEYENNANLPFCLLEMIKEIIVDGNETYRRYLNMLIGYFNRLVEKKTTVRACCKQNKEYKISFLSSILYLLPYAAQIFQETNDINYFMNLYSVLVMEINNIDEQASALVNQYIFELLSSENMTQHKILIIMLFQNQFSLSEQNNAKYIKLITFLLNKLPKFNLNNEVTNLIYQNLFKNSSSYIVNHILNGSLKLHILLNAIYQFNIHFIQKCKLIEGNPMFNHEVELIKQITIFVSDISIDNKEDIKNNKTSIIHIVGQLVNIFYKNGVDLMAASGNLLSASISKVLCNTAAFIKIDDFNYFSQLIYSMCSLSQNDKDEIVESEDTFYYDFYDINLQNNDFSSRQALATLVCRLPKTVEIISLMLNPSNVDQITETHFYLISLVNTFIETSYSDETIKNHFYQLTTAYLNKASEILSELTPQTLSQNIDNTILILTIYLFISSSFFLLKDDEIKQFNNEITRLMAIIEAFSEEFPGNNQIRSFFTFYCILTTKLFERSQLSVPADQILPFTNKYFDSCITNHGITLINLLAFDGNNLELLVQVFARYLAECERMLLEISMKMATNEADEDDPNQDIYFDIPDEKQYNYVLRFFSDNISKMSKIIRLVDFSNFDEFQERLQNILQFVVVKGEDWPFVDESLELASAILIKAPNFKDWTQFYVKLAFQADREIFFSEWVNPIIEFISLRAELIDQEFIDFLLVKIKEGIQSYFDSLYDSSIHVIPTYDALNIFALVMRLFEFGFSSIIQIPIEAISYYLEIAVQSLPTEEFIRGNDEDYFLDDHKFGIYMVRLASFLANPNLNIEELGHFIEEIVNNGQIVCNEIRYIIITLIDNVFKPDENSELNELRRLCLTNEIPKNDTFKEIYNSDIKYLCGNIRHPIYSLYSIEGFKFDDADEVNE